MRYSVAAFVIQIIALVCGLGSLGLASYVFHYDRQWYKIVQLHGHIYFESFVTRILSDVYRAADDIFPYGGFEKHHRIRTDPPDYFASNFLRYTKSPEIVFMALLVLTNLMQLCALVITCARKVRFLPQPCRENGCWYIIIGIICTTAIIELQSRLEINSFYATFQKYANSPSPYYYTPEKIGATMLASCGGRGWQFYESLLQNSGTGLLGERDGLYVCQRFWFFVAAVTLEFLCALLCIIIAVILCCFWTKKTHVDQADAEESLETENHNQFDNQHDQTKQDILTIDENPRIPTEDSNDDSIPNSSGLQQQETEIIDKEEMPNATENISDDKTTTSTDDDQNKATGSDNDPMKTHNLTTGKKMMDATNGKSEDKSSKKNPKDKIPKNKTKTQIQTKKKEDKGT